MSSPEKSVLGLSKQASFIKTAAGVPGPMPGTRITEEYVRMVGRDAYFWGWPMVNLYSRGSRTRRSLRLAAWESPRWLR